MLAFDRRPRRPRSLFTQLFAQLPDDAIRRISVRVTYAHTAGVEVDKAGGISTPPTVPVIRAPYPSKAVIPLPIIVGEAKRGTSEIIGDLEEHLSAWYDAFRPAKTGLVCIDLVLFGSLSDQHDRPLIRFRQLLIPFQYILPDND